MKGLKISVCLLAGSLLLLGCGSTTGGGSTRTGGGTGGTESSAAVDGTVSVPRSTTTNVSLGLSASSSVSKGSSLSGSSVSEDSSSEASQIIVTKATTDDSSTSGTCVFLTPSGTPLDNDCSYSSGTMSTGTCGFDCSKLDSTKQVEAKCTSTDGKVVSVLFDATSCTNGSSVSAGTLDASSTALLMLVYNGVDSNATPDSKTTTWLSQIATGAADLKKMLQTLKVQLEEGSSGSAGSSNAKESVFATFKALREGIANISGFDFSKMHQEISNGFPATKGFVSGSTIDWGAVGTAAARAAATTFNFFADSSTAGKWNTAEEFKALGKTFGTYDASELQSCITTPANCRSTLNQYVGGGQAALDRMAQSGKGIAEFMEKCGGQSLASGHFDAMKKLFDEMDFNSAGSSKDELGASVCSQIKAADTASELTQLITNAGNIAKTIFKDPFALANDDGILAQGWINVVGTGGDITLRTPCSTTLPCPSGQTCSLGLCSSSVAGLGTGTGKFGDICSANGDCASNTCLNGKCDWPSGIGFATLIGLKLFGVACNNTGECINGLTCNVTCGGGGGGGGGGDSVTKYYAYVVNQGDKGIKVFDVNPTSGALTAISGTSSFSVGVVPNRIAATADEKFLYVTSAAGSHVSRFSIAVATGALTSLGSATTAPDQATGIAVQAIAGTTYLYTANPGNPGLGSANVSRFIVGADGSLSSRADYQDVPQQAHREVVINAAGTCLFTTDADIGISAFAVGSGGALTARPNSPFTNSDGNGCDEGIAIRPSGSHLYCLHGMASLLLAFAIDVNCDLTGVDTSTAATGGNDTTNLGYNIGDMPTLKDVCVSPDGSCAFTVHGMGGIRPWKIGPDGLLNVVIPAGNPPVSKTVATAATPQACAVDPQSKFVYAPSNDDNTVSVYTIDANTCALTAGTAVSTGAGSGPVDITVIGIVQ